MDEFIFYRKKFEKSQRAKAANQDDKNKSGDQKVTIGNIELDLNKEMFDPKNM